MAGWELDPDATVARWAALEVAWFARYASGELTILQQRAGRVRDFCRVPPTGTEARAIEEFDRLGAASMRPAGDREFPDVPGTPWRARFLASGRPVGVLTNGETAYQTRKLRELGLADERVPLPASSDLPAAKPDARLPGRLRTPRVRS